MHIYYLLNITKGTQSSMIFFDPVTFKKNVKKKKKPTFIYELYQVFCIVLYLILLIKMLLICSE